MLSSLRSQYKHEFLSGIHDPYSGAFSTTLQKLTDETIDSKVVSGITESSGTDQHLTQRNDSGYSTLMLTASTLTHSELSNPLKLDLDPIVGPTWAS
jgi:hypothetical protein